MTTILMIRHGQSEANNLDVFAGNYDVELTELGVQQAKCTADFSAKNYKVDKIYASDLKRAFKTAQIIADKCNLEVITEQNFREISAGKWEAVKFDDITKLYSDDYSIWRNDIGNARCTEGESVKELAKRVCDTLLKVARENEDKTVVIGTHATPVRVAKCVFGGYSFDNMMDIPWASNASVTELTYNDGVFTVVFYGKDDFLTDLKSYLPVNV